MLQSYPSLTENEFSQACQALELRCSDGLQGTDWLSVKWTNPELRIRQVRRLLPPKQPAGGIEKKVSEDAEYNGEEDDLEIVEEYETLAVERDYGTNNKIVVDFSVTLSPTYSVPVLWFTCPSLQSLDDIHNVLIPVDSSNLVRNIGVMGGISRAYHPVSDLPAFFVHPCNTHAALLAVHDGTVLTSEAYLFVWLGVVGSAVGLHVPSNMLTAEK